MNLLSQLRARGLTRRLRKATNGASQETQFVPTPLSVARDMLVFAETTAADVVYDPGSGDGRIPILAAQEFGCNAVGIELDRKLYNYARERTRQYNLTRQVRFEHNDLFAADYRPATVVLLYLLSATTEHLQPLLSSRLRPGARIVSLDFPIPGWEPEATCEVTSIHDVKDTLLLYRRPSPSRA